MGTGLSSGCRKLGTTPAARAGATSQAAFSMSAANFKRCIGPKENSHISLIAFEINTVTAISTYFAPSVRFGNITEETAQAAVTGENFVQVNFLARSDNMQPVRSGLVIP